MILFIAGIFIFESFDLSESSWHGNRLLPHSWLLFIVKSYIIKNKICTLPFVEDFQIASRHHFVTRMKVWELWKKTVLFFWKYFHRFCVWFCSIARIILNRCEYIFAFFLCWSVCHNALTRVMSRQLTYHFFSSFYVL